MKVINLGKEVRGLEEAARIGERWSDLPEEAKRRHGIVLFMQKHGVKAAMDASGMGRRTLFLLQARLRNANGDPRALIPK